MHHLSTEELWRKLRNDNNPLADTLSGLLDGNEEEIAQAQLATGQAVHELHDEKQVVDDLYDELYVAESVIEDKLVEIDALKASLALSNRIGQALTKHRSRSK